MAPSPRRCTPTRLLPSFCQDLLHPIFLPEVSLADELDLDASVRRHLSGVLPNPVPKRLGELRVVEVSGVNYFFGSEI
jgi:hypothetical protein